MSASVCRSISRAEYETASFDLVAVVVTLLGGQLPDWRDITIRLSTTTPEEPGAS